MEYYLEYEIIYDKPGILGDISTLLGKLSINIVTINGVGKNRRGLLIKTDNPEIYETLESKLLGMEKIKLLKFREAKLVDKLAVRHGRYIKSNEENKRVFSFLRSELGILVDFIAELLKENKHKLIGVRGSARSGKTESLIAASVCANKHWIFISSTMIKQTLRESLMRNEFDTDNVFIIDGIISSQSRNDRHQQIVREIMTFDAVKVIEHPDFFCKNSSIKIEDFDYIIELRNYPEEVIDSVELIQQMYYGDPDY
ncbi:MAG: hypothetical protein K0R18_1571 [Bacillales bacterium]|jgi:hypothetical protein|nr:hypothetical protein [Bacillales bacterium]